MSLQGLLVAHGEKVVVALVAVLGVWSISNTINDTKSITKADDHSLAGMSRDFRQAADKKSEPNFNPVRKFNNELKDRLAIRLESRPQPSYIWEHPDIGGGVVKPPDIPVYSYEIGVPKVAEIKDKVGLFEVDFTLPEAQRPNKEWDYLKDDPAGATFTWRFAVDGPERERDVINKARIAALIAEYRIGQKGPWLRLDTPKSLNGVVPLEGKESFVTLQLGNVQEGLLYQFRGRLVAAATGFAFTQGQWVPAEGSQIMVHSPAIGEVDVASKKAIEALQSDQVRRNQAEVLGAGDVNGVNVGALERLYGGVYSEVAQRGAPSSFRMAVYRVTAAVAGVPARARVLVMKKVLEPGKPAQDAPWTEAKEYKPKVGDRIGKEGDLVKVGDDNVRLNMLTPWVVKEINPQVQRIRYWKVSRRSVPVEGGGFSKNKVLTIEPVERRSSTIILENLTTKETVEMVRLESHIAPPTGRGVFSYPAIAEAGIKELDAFKADPAEFRQPSLQPDKPKLHNDRKLLERLAAAGKINRLIVPGVDLPYVEMPDGRVLFYDPNNSSLGIQVVIRPGSVVDRAGGLDKAAPEEAEGEGEGEAEAEGDAAAP